MGKKGGKSKMETGDVVTATPSVGEGFMRLEGRKIDIFTTRYYFNPFKNIRFSR